MKSADRTPAGWGRSLVREAWGTLLPGVLAVALFLILPRDSRSQTAPARPGASSPAAALCGAWHRGSGESVPLDLGRVKRAYSDLRARLAQSLDARDREPAAQADRPYDAGLPACRSEEDRTLPLDPEKGRQVRGRTFYFLAVTDPARAQLPLEVEKDPAVQVLVVRARSLANLPEITRRLGRSVSLGSADFAKALGVRCSNTVVKISEKGDAIVLHESR